MSTGPAIQPPKPLHQQTTPLHEAVFSPTTSQERQDLQAGTIAEVSSGASRQEHIKPSLTFLQKASGFFDEALRIVACFGTAFAASDSRGLGRSPRSDNSQSGGNNNNMSEAERVRLQSQGLANSQYGHPSYGGPGYDSTQPTQYQPAAADGSSTAWPGDDRATTKPTQTY